MERNIFSINDESEFEQAALRVFRTQAEHCAPYRRYVETLGVRPDEVSAADGIPFLPISFFKTFRVTTGDAAEQLLFESSGTTGVQTSRHYVASSAVYDESLQRGFELRFGRLQGLPVLGLLPHYLERRHSSLAYMVRQWAAVSGHADSGFYIRDTDTLYDKLCVLCNRRQRALLIGVSFALLDFAEKYSLEYPQLMVMETGGMKGRGGEIARNELHRRLQCAFKGATICSEYGMTELLSQAYSRADGVFHTPPWMRVRVRDLYNPLAAAPIGEAGGIDITDLANMHSCAFIQTEDLGRQRPDGGFEVLGRISGAIHRGCNALVEGV